MITAEYRARIEELDENNLIGRISCKDWHCLMDYLRENDFLNNPMVISSEGGTWSAKVYERP